MCVGSTVEPLNTFRGKLSEVYKRDIKVCPLMRGIFLLCPLVRVSFIRGSTVYVVM